MLRVRLIGFSTRPKGGAAAVLLLLKLELPTVEVDGGGVLGVGDRFEQSCKVERSHGVCFSVDFFVVRHLKFFQKLLEASLKTSNSFWKLV